MFSGSYDPGEMTLLLRPEAIPVLSLEEKEELIRKGSHYSDMLSEEPLPDAARMAFYRETLERSAPRLARESLWLARMIARETPDPIRLLGIARAGNPLCALLVRALRFLGRDASGCGISVIRGRGIDRAAFEFARPFHGKTWFIDGWTGKGAIASELKGLGGKLCVLSDPAGIADLSASCDDWPIPFGILGATVSGLISRTVWAGDGFHKCLFHAEWSHLDETNRFLDTVSALWKPGNAIERIMRERKVADVNHVKPGLAEATRAVSRRTPILVLATDPGDPDLSLLVEMAARQGIPVEAEDVSPYRAIAVIR